MTPPAAVEEEEEREQEIRPRPHKKKDIKITERPDSAPFENEIFYHFGRDCCPRLFLDGVRAQQWRADEDANKSPQRHRRDTRA